MEPDQVKRRLEAVRSASRSLALLLDSDPAAPGIVAVDGPLPDRATYLSVATEACDSGGVAALRAEKRRRLLEIAARDLAAEEPLEEVGRALADLADACLQATLLAVEASDGLAVIAMGKLGARELNYASDIDLIFISESGPAAPTKAAERLLAELGGVHPEGQAFRIDTNLRPEGRSGALVRSFEGALEYYRRWAKPWEYQALIKARSAAGNSSVGEALVEATRELVYATEVSEERVASIRKMKETVEDHARSARRTKSAGADDVKLGPGGIRDIEFSAQLLQLVHGGSDSTVRDRATLDALDALVDGGYMAEEDGAGLGVAYRWLRAVEHRIQLWQERQVHHLPRDPESLARIARSLGFQDSPSSSAAERFDDKHNSVLIDVRSRFEKLFYRPMIESLAEATGTRLSEAALKDRLRILGFRDVERAARTLTGLVAGTTRRAKLFRVLTPALLRWLASTPLPDEGLFAFLRLGEALESRADVLASLRDNPPAIAFLARVLGSGRLLGEVLLHVPEELATIADARGPGPIKDRDRLVREAVASLEWRDPSRWLDGLRRFKRREMLRVALCDLAGEIHTNDVGVALADLADSCLEAALHGRDIPFAVIGMGKLGGRELNFASDIDVMFVHDADPEVAEDVAEKLLKAIGEVTPEGQAFRIDPALRPEGKSGPLARSLNAYLEYYRRWSRPWEHQALIKARWVAGDRELAEKLIAETRELTFPQRIPEGTLPEIRHLKARMERERIPRGSDPRRNFKLGPGGMSDVEFAAQVLQIKHASEHPELQTTSTIAAIEGASRAGLLGDEDATKLLHAYELLTRIRNKLFLMIARPSEALPARPEDTEALGVALGYSDQPRQELEEDYLKATRRARAVAERIIYG